MKNKTWIIIAVAFAAIMIAAAVLYPKLAEQFAENNETVPTNDSTVNEDTKGTKPIAVKQTDDFTVYDMDGNAVKLSDFFGKPIVVNFWATWCGPCLSELPAFETAYKKYGNDMVFLMVNLAEGAGDPKDKVKAFVENEGYSFPVYLDTKEYASAAYGIYSIPETLFINSDGSLFDFQIGAMSEKALFSGIENITRGSK